MGAGLAALGAVALAAWAGVLLHPARPWDLRPRDAGQPAPPDPACWPEVCVLVPAHDEAALLPRTLPALLAQDYPGTWRVVLVDDRSRDGTAGVAAAHATERLTVVAGTPLPDGWAGKVWALDQGARLASAAGYLLLTDADILHGPRSLRDLVADAEARRVALDSRMARLHVSSLAERLLVPPFVFFFALLYPMRWVNDPRRRLAAAAGGCVLLRRDALEAIGGFGAIAGAVIDDVALAAAVKRRGLPIRLASAGEEIRSLRAYGTPAAFWRTVRRTAFTQLRHSLPLLAVTTALLLVLFAGPPALVAAGAVTGRWWLLGLGAAGWLAAAAAYVPTLRLYGVSPAWAVSLPLAGVLYGGMTLDSARAHLTGGRGAW
jgi:hopene-associated glycosyltransferase HpnB